VSRMLRLLRVPLFELARHGTACLTQRKDMLTPATQPLLPSQVRTEEGLLAYLSRLRALHGTEVLDSLGAITRLRLQSELYSLTTAGVKCGLW